MNKKMISVILPAYNAERFIRESIDSILGQTYTNFELIVLNDGSSDKTEEIVLSYDDPRIRYVKNEENLKLIKTLNKGIDLARGEFIARMDADDISLPERFEEEIELFDKNIKVSIVSCFPNNIDESGHFLCHSSYFVCTQNGSCRFVSLFETPILHPGVMYKTEVIRQYMYNDSPDCYHIEAQELWYRMLYDGVQCKIAPKYLVNYRDNSDSVCHVYNDVQMERQMVLSINCIKKELGVTVDEASLKLLLDKKEKKSIQKIKNTYKLLKKIKKEYINRYSNELTDKEVKEINIWCKQRKLSIIMTSIFVSQFMFRFQLVCFLCLHLNLLLCRNNIVYLKNRFIRIKNISC